MGDILDEKQIFNGLMVLLSFYVGYKYGCKVVSGEKSKSVDLDEKSGGIAVKSSFTSAVPPKRLNLLSFAELHRLWRLQDGAGGAQRPENGQGKDWRAVWSCGGGSV